MWMGVNMIEVFNESNRTMKHVGMACSSELFVEVHWCTVNVVLCDLITQSLTPLIKDDVNYPVKSEPLSNGKEN